MRSFLATVLIILVLVPSLSKIPHYTQNQINQKIGQTPIMYGNTIRIRASMFTFHIHSHLVNYSRGSGYQSVTGMPDGHDYNSLWTVKEAHQEQMKTYDQQVKCGDSIRLEHTLTRKNLHSEDIFQSMITLGGEVSAFGEKGVGDDNDNWIVKCQGKEEGEGFTAGIIFELVHENTEKMLKLSRYYQYSFQNWENCPFQGQLEVSTASRSTKETLLKIVGGVFFKSKEVEDTKVDGKNPEDQL